MYNGWNIKYLFMDYLKLFFGMWLYFGKYGVRLVFCKFECTLELIGEIEKKD